ncbi:MAG: glycosyltransferase family 2 protein [Phycisphaerales bacterium]
MTTSRTLIAIPVYNEEHYVPRVLAHVLEYADDVLVVDDGSTDRTPNLLCKFPVEVIRHAHNRGYGRSLRDAFTYAACHGYDWVITMDCDEQHEPAMIPEFVASASENRYDIVSGSRYVGTMDAETRPPADRRAINAQITAEINERLGVLFGEPLTDAFCGFKAHRVSTLRRLHLTEDGYAFPMQLWVQAAAQGLRVAELPVKLIYKDLSRTFGGQLDDPTTRLAHYRCVLHRELRRQARLLPAGALTNADACVG